ncbi:MAG TPA: WhiB family transcriptional regulator [Beutenbergiaceae bacterium]|nr:WhiB family transcriptional regulator [Beutenbergiaceae bacterium]
MSTSLDVLIATEDLDLTLPCQNLDTVDLWFAEHAPDLKRAQSLCGTCPLRVECLQGALEREEPWGVWGGEIFVDGKIVANKRGRGRPRKHPLPSPSPAESAVG